MPPSRCSPTAPDTSCPLPKRAGFSEGPGGTRRVLVFAAPPIAPERPRHLFQDPTFSRVPPFPTPHLFPRPRLPISSVPQRRWPRPNGPAIRSGGMSDNDKRGGTGPNTGVVVRARPKTRKPAMYKVLMLNDDYTPMESGSAASIRMRSPRPRSPRSWTWRGRTNTRCNARLKKSSRFTCHCFQWFALCSGRRPRGSFVAPIPAHIKTVPVTPG
jgi:hypothetical protein